MCIIDCFDMFPHISVS